MTAAGSAGLSTHEAARRLATDGPNQLPTPRTLPAWRRFAAELVHFFALLFWVAGALAFVAGLPQLGIAILLVVVLNGAFAFAQEQRAEHAAERLRDLLPRRATVVRDGKPLDIPATELVLGDLVLLREGDRVCADVRLGGVHALAVDTSMLTGESVPNHPGEGDSAFAGEFVLEGEASGVVTAIGADTRLAAITHLAGAVVGQPTPLRRELDRISRLVAILAVAVGTGFFALAVWLGTPATEGFLFAIGVTVALVPEGLLPTVTLSLAVGAQRMAAHHALVRHLEAVETLGSTTFICTDKTGTLTRNEMTVVEVWTPAGRVALHGAGYTPHAEINGAPDAIAAATRLGRDALRCSNGRVVDVDGGLRPHGDPMEAALHVLALRLGVDEAEDVAARPERGRHPFDARRRRMSVIVGEDLVVKGAPDAVMPRCAPSHGVEAEVADLARRGLRVLAVACRVAPVVHASDPDTDESDLELLGLVGLEDPPREGAAEAIAACRRAGILVAMVTGDHPDTALAIAREVGLADAGDTALIGAALPDDPDELGALLDRAGTIVARVAPEDKLRIAAALGRRGHVVAMTGDGVNDVPALREAAIGVAMGRSGTDVAREAADLVLLDDDFATIVRAVEQGRSTYANIRRFLTYHLTDNVAELAPFVLWALTGGTIPLAIGVLQVLALDIGTDVLPALALGTEPPAATALDRPPTRRHLLDRAVLTRAFGVLGPTEAAVELAAFFATFLAAGWRPGEDFPGGATLLAASGAAFSAVVIGQTANVFACRSTVRPVWRRGTLPATRTGHRSPGPGERGSGRLEPLGRTTSDVRGPVTKRTANRYVRVAAASELLVLAVFLLWSPIAEVLEHAAPTAAGLAVAALAAPAVLIADGVQKSAVRRQFTIRRGGR